MAKTVFTDAFIEVDGNDISDHVREVSLSYSAEEVDDTTMGSDTTTNLGGLKSWSLEITVANDFAASEVDSIVFPLVGAKVPITFRPTSDPVGSGNPEYSGTGMLNTYNPIGQSTGDLATAPLNFSSASSLSRSTS